jgi:glutaconate CoA-transferase subunit B
MPGGGPASVITDLGVYDFEGEEMRLVSLHPGMTVETVRENTGWELRVAPDLRPTEPPGPEELRIIRETLDPGRLYL